MTDHAEILPETRASRRPSLAEIAGEYACPGVTEPTEPSEDAELVLDTATLSVESALRRLLPAAIAFLAAPP